MDCPGISQWKQHHQPVKEARRGWNTLAVTFVHYIFQLLLLLAHLYAVRSFRFKWNEFEVDGYRAWSWTCITFIGLVTANHFPFALDAGAAQYLFPSRQTLQVPAYVHIADCKQLQTRLKSATRKALFQICLFQMHIDLLWWWVCSWHGMTIRMKMNDGRVSSSSSMLVWLHYKRNALCEFNRPQITNRLERFNSPVNEGIWSTSRYLNQAVEDFWKETTFKRWIFFEFFTEKRLV